MKIWKKRMGRGAGGVIGPARLAPILKLPPAPEGAFGRVRQARQALQALFIEKR